MLLNELVTEEEPYADQWKNFDGRGPFGAANYAKQGNRPTLRGKASEFVESLIKKCWHGNPEMRPSFENMQESVRHPEFKIYSWQR